MPRSLTPVPRRLRARTAPALPTVAAALVAVAVVACRPADGGTARDGRAPASSAAADTQPRSGNRIPPRGEAWVVFGGDTVRAEVASTASERERGLMYREEVPPGTGMLFVFDQEEIRSFWMRNTYVALDIAYLDASMRVVDVQQMEPGSEELYESSAPAMFALEVPRGWFREHGVREGARAEIVFGPR